MTIDWPRLIENKNREISRLNGVYQGLLDAAGVDRYLGAWRAHLSSVVEALRPDLIHSHHVWLMSSVLKDIAPDTPVVTHCHATGLRQMVLCPHLAERVVTLQDEMGGSDEGDAEQRARDLAVTDRLLDLVLFRLHGVDPADVEGFRDPASAS